MAGRLLAISDLHVGYPENRAYASALHPEDPDDWLIVAGDVGEVFADVGYVLATLAGRFARVIWTPGNHELWTLPSDPVPVRGVARYEALVKVCQRFGVLTPEDEFPVWPGPGAPDGPVTVAPLFTLYDYSFSADSGAATRDRALSLARAAGMTGADEERLHPEPYPSVEAWCHARVAASAARLAAVTGPLVLVSHWPLVRAPVAALRHPEFAPWCGTTLTADWHRSFPVVAAVYGHLHIPRTTFHDGVRFEEVSVGYPRQWQRRGDAPQRPRVILGSLRNIPLNVIQAFSKQPYKAVCRWWIIVTGYTFLFTENPLAGGKMPGERLIHDGVADPDAISTRQEFGAALTLLRERAGLTVRDVARKLGVPSATIGDYFAGRHVPSLKPPDQLARILAACGVHDVAEIHKWLDALGRVRRAPGRRPARAPVPYRGLKSFQPEDAEWFYGRRRLTGVLLEKLRDRYAQGGLLAVVGPSGSGKSSLLRAGLIPQLRSGALGIPGSGDWPLILLTPGARPARDLAARLAAVAARAPDQRAVIVVDQFEETFTSCQEESERLAFIRALCAAAGHDREPAALVVIGFRADFYPHALQYPELVSALQSRQVLVGPMTEEELRSAITGPADHAGLDIEDGLVEVLLRDLAPAANYPEPPAAHDAGALPLLSHALLATWERSRGGRLTVADYRDSGGISGAVAASTEEVYAELTPGQQELARRIFTRLVHVSDHTATTRRRVRTSELLQLHADAQPVLDAFIEKRLITAGTDDVEIAHEALLHAWPRLRQWIDSDSIGRTHRQLTAAAEIWRDSERDPSALYSGGRLAAAEEWAALPAHGDDLNVPEREFLDASMRQRLAAERSARRQTRRLRSLAGALAALFLVAGTLAVVAYQQKNTATGQRDVAISRQLATNADQLRTTDIALAMQLSLAAYRISPTAEAISSLLDATAEPPATRMLGPAGTEMLSIALSRDGALLATGADNGTVRLWSLARPGHPLLLMTPLSMAGPVSSLAFSPDGSLLAISAGGTVSLWNVSDPRRPFLDARIPAVPGAAQNTVAYSPDGQTLATADASGRVYLWDTTDPRHPSPRGTPIAAGTGQVDAIAFSPDGAVLAAGGANGHLRLWELRKGDARPAAIAFLNGPANGINAIAFSPDSRTLAAAGNDSRVWLWTLGDGGRAIATRPPLTGARSWIYSLAFSPAGNTIAAGSADDNAYVWSMPDGVLTTTLPHPVPVTAVAYGPGGDTLATGDADDIAQLWTLPGPVLGAPADSSVFTVAFSPDRDILAAASAPPSGYGSVQLWNPASHDQPAPLGPPLTAPGGLDGTVAYGPAGRLAAGGDKGSVVIWDVRDPRHPVQLRTPATALNSAIQYVAFDKTGRLMAAGSTDGTVELWDTADFARTTPLAVFAADTTGPATYRDVFAVAFSPDDRLLATAAADGTVRLWDISDPSRPRQLDEPLTRLADAVYQVTFSPDGRVLAASGEDGDVRLWDVTEPGRPRLLSVLSGPVGIVYDVAFSPDARTLATADGDKTITLWNIADPATPAKIGALTGPAGTVFSVAFSPDGTTLAAGSQDDTTRLWMATPASAAAYACAITGDPMTRAEWAQYMPELPYNPPCETG